MMKIQNCLVSATVCMVLAVASATAQSGQQNDKKALIKVVYEFIHVDDSTQRDRPRQEDTFLYINSTSSMYRRSNEEEGEYYRYLQGGGSKETYNINSILAKTSSLYHSVPEQKTISTERIIEQMFQINEPLHAIMWDIREEQKQIGDYLAQLATGSFRGRDYSVWFVPDIPMPFGPWKLQGLPGLILEARDSREDVIFVFKSLERIDGQVVNIESPKGIKQVSGAEYARTYKAFMDNPTAFIRATSAPGTNVVVGSGRSTRAGSNTLREKVYNNPLELTNR